MFNIFKFIRKLDRLKKEQEERYVARIKAEEEYKRKYPKNYLVVFMNKGFTYNG